jgi:hypothetical protein
MDVNALIADLWVSSTLFHWATVGYAIILVAISIYISVTDWNGAVITFYQWVDKAKQAFRR